MSRDRASSRWVALMALLVAAGCGDSTDTTCGEGTEKQGDTCVATTDDGTAGSDATSGTCGEGTFESDGECVAKGPIGATCATSDECASGACLKESDGAPAGYCTQLSCSDSKPCPGGSHCMYSAANNSYLCLATCDSEDSCREGYVCQPLYTTDHDVCIPDCRTASFCSSSTVCDEDSGLCEPVGCDPSASESSCDEGRLCAPNLTGVGDSAGLCLPECAEADDCLGTEVCQPLTADASGPAVCVPPVCESDNDCSAGLHCMDNTCMPPETCDDEGACSEEDYVCVGGAGGSCMPACPSEGGCDALHEGLTCAESVGACLPTGDFPGSPCRADKNDACGGIEAGDSSLGLTCVNDMCMVPCGASAEVCGAVSDTLACAQDILAEDVCLPKGTFPGGPCGESDACDAITDDSGDTWDMACVQNTCTISCEAGNAGDKLCAGFDAALICAADLGPDGSDVCLPRGSYPSAPCAAGAECNEGLYCTPENTCLTDCTTGGNTLCEAVRADLVCATGIYEADVCLPKGSFPGGPCTDAGTCQDLQLPGDTAAMACVQDVCALTCTPDPEGSAFCTAIQNGLLCADLGAVGACLPQGTFPGSACDEQNPCTGEPGLVCYGGSCAVGCDSSSAETGVNYCTAVGSQLGTGFDACANPYDQSAGDICIVAPQ